ncbi:MAG: hypothetical protein O2960_01755 [Verrucomicrobia bacterium]|nr:hypothetical protein [Verrucomicrobiota bacterium]
MGKKSRFKKLRRQVGGQSDWLPGQIEQAARLKEEFPECRVVRVNGGEKMSEVLGTFAEPLLEHATTREEREKAFSFATIVWNYSIARLDPGIGFGRDLDSILRDPRTREVFDLMLARKELLYPENRRIILDFQLNDTPEKYHLNVVSTMRQSEPGADASNGANPTPEIKPHSQNQAGSRINQSP